jgi:kinesin family protein 4/21/27
VFRRLLQQDNTCLCALLLPQVLDGELAQRAEATRRLREVQKQLMLLGGLVPPSPVVTAAAAAAARGRRNSGNPLSSGGGAAGSSGGLPEEATLMQEAKHLQESIDGHTKSIKVWTSLQVMC